MSNIDIHNINDYLLYHGHIQNRRNQITNSFRDYMIDLYDIANDQYRISKPRNYSLGKLKEQAYEFYDKNNFQLHDVGILTDNDVYRLLDGKDISGIEDIIKILNEGATFDSPFNIPINLSSNSCFQASTVNQIPSLEDDIDYKRLLMKLNVYFDSINISKTIGDITTSSYIHEITHTQLEGQKGIIEDLYNAEVLSIFNELLYAYNTDQNVFLILLRHRINDTYSSFSYIYEHLNDETISYRTHMNYKYLISTLKAIELLNIYVSRYGKYKKEITEEINKVYNGVQSLEALLSKLEITNESAMESKYTKKIFYKFDKTG